MSNLFQLLSATKSYGSKRLFADAGFAVNEGEHVGVIGPNGAGKTTLFRVVSGQEGLDTGQVIKARNLQVGYLEQHDNWLATDTVEDFVSRDSKIPVWELKSIGKRELMLPDAYFSKPIASLSGGYRMRCKLLWLLGQQPTILLLDEPTNYLDLETTLVLERFLQEYRGAFLLISHDREFLRRTTDHIVEVESGEITKYNGNIDDYFEQKDLLRTQLQARALSAQQKRQEVLDFVARFGAKATKARQAQSRLKALAKMETIEVKPLPVSAVIKIPTPPKTGKLIADFSDVTLGYGERVILSDVNFRLESGNHIAVVGLNGAGKSTFLKALAQRLEPMQGKVDYGPSVTVGYFAQHVSESLDPADTVIDQIKKNAHPDVTRQEALNLAGALLFSGDDMTKKVSMLSGGERSRVALGKILLQKNPLLVLDEPTNHLDFQTVESLTQALVGYPGTIVVVSHDRGFIRRVGKNILEVNSGKVRRYLGTYDEYVWSLQKGDFADQTPEPQSIVSTKADAAAPQSARHLDREQTKALQRDLRKCTKTLEDLDKELQNLQTKLSVLNDEITQQASSREGIFDELADVQRRIETAEAQWLETSELKESLEKQLT
ncbi:MAG: ATP-binding cassette domain-containing protein [Oligoflexales bacterium]